MKKVIAILFLIFSTQAVFAFTPSAEVMFVSGTVVDKQNHETLGGVAVHVKGTSITVYTDFDGNFFLPDLPRGNYELEFDYITYSSSQLVTDNCDHCSALTVEMDQRN
jgi:hypothetical protein